MATAFSNAQRTHHRGRSSQASNPYETFARYEEQPFRQVHDQQVPFGNAPLYGDQSPHTRPPINGRKSSNNTTLKRMLSRQKKLEDLLHQALSQGGGQRGAYSGHPDGYNFDPSAGQSNIQRHGSKRPDYTLAGPRGPPPSDQYRGYRDPDYQDPPEDTGKPVWGLAKPLPRVSRRRKGGRKSGKQGNRTKSVKKAKGGEQGAYEQAQQDRSHHPKGQVGGGPAGHQGAGDDTQGNPQGEAAGGPATQPRRQEMDGNNQDSWVEHFADGLVNPLGNPEREDSRETLVEDEEEEEEDEEDEEIPNYWFSIRRRLREPFAEWLATATLVALGTCGNLQVKTSSESAGNFTQEGLVWGFATMMSIYIAGGISGAHCNPTVSIFLSIFRGFPLRKAVYYIIAQIAGAFTGVFIAYGIYHDAIMNFDPHKTSTSKGSGTAFFTLPASFVQPAEAFFTDFFSAGIQAFAVLAIGDDSNAPPGAGMHALIIGLIAFVLASSLGYNTGPQTNPAKDLATRAVAWTLGYQDAMWQKAWWAEAWTASIIGGCTGALIYDIFLFEGSESPINYPQHRRKEVRRREKQRWNLWGKLKRRNNNAEDADEEVGLEKGQDRGSMDQSTSRLNLPAFWK